MLLPDVIVYPIFIMFVKHNLFVCTDVIMQTMLFSEFIPTPVGWVITIHPRAENKQIMTLHYNICATRVIMPSTITSVHMRQINEFTKQHNFSNYNNVSYLLVL